MKHAISVVEDSLMPLHEKLSTEALLFKKDVVLVDLAELAH
jgi:hypothetical protein